MILSIIATVVMFTDSVLSGLLWALGIKKWALMNGKEMNPILRWLSLRVKSNTWVVWARALWVLYWGVVIAAAWTIPVQVGNTEARNLFCIFAILLSGYGILTMIRKDE